MLDLAEATDNCGPVSIAVDVVTTPGNATGNYTVTRTFTATDDAGNSTSLVQTITVVDTTPPVLVVPEDFVVECSDGITLELAEATDNCGPVSIAADFITVQSDAIGKYLVTRTFTATDDAGNSTLLPNHHGPGHHGARVHLRPCRLHGRMPDEMSRTMPRRRTTAVR